MDFNCFGVSGCASGSALAAAVMTLSSCADGMATDARLDTFDIVFYLATIGSARAYYPSHLTTIYKGHAVEDLGFWRERYYAQLSVFEAIIDPNQLLERRVGRLVTLQVSLREVVYDLAPHATSRTASVD